MRYCTKLSYLDGKDFRATWELQIFETQLLPSIHLTSPFPWLFSKSIKTVVSMMVSLTERMLCFRQSLSLVSGTTLTFPRFEKQIRKSFMRSLHGLFTTWSQWASNQWTSTSTKAGVSFEAERLQIFSTNWDVARASVVLACLWSPISPAISQRIQHPSAWHPQRLSVA